MVEEPNKDNVKIGDILIENINKGIRYLPIIEITDRSIIAESCDRNYKCIYPFNRFSEIIVLKGLSLLVGKSVNKKFLDDINNDLIIRAEYAAPGEIIRVGPN